MTQDEAGDDIDAIRSLPRFRDLTCQTCSHPIRVHALTMYASCPQCDTRHKCRSFGGVGTEIQDVIEAVLQWADISAADVIARHEQQATNGDA
jgi:hypothetical protein